MLLSTGTGLLLFLGITLIATYYLFKTKQYKWMFPIGLVHIILSPFYSITVGSLILGMGMIQMYMAFLNTKKPVKAISPE
ncbi:hypothetical protein LCM20_02710 [Halobacillus litoralis]|uniref:hypothetical protein n=1 Tax=Halobacillus litoralis TaxID=45668 RepID=UPI001CD588B7|nr:hypothetical protein [Halobacillus litoralis]MCA0969502.1 hypothetical protein [Halobacillus litoralis]